MVQGNVADEFTKLSLLFTWLWMITTGAMLNKMFPCFKNISGIIVLRWAGKCSVPSFSRPAVGNIPLRWIEEREGHRGWYLFKALYDAARRHVYTSSLQHRPHGQVWVWAAVWMDLGCYRSTATLLCSLMLLHPDSCPGWADVPTCGGGWHHQIGKHQGTQGEPWAHHGVAPLLRDWVNPRCSVILLSLCGIALLPWRRFLSSGKAELSPLPAWPQHPPWLSNTGPNSASPFRAVAGCFHS